MKKIAVAFIGIITLLLPGCNKASNEPKIFKIAKTYDKIGMRYHYNSGCNVGALGWLSCEGLIQYVRTTDEYFFQLAESIDHNDDHTSIIHVRQNVKWHDGTTFTADDVLAYYGIIYSTVSNHLATFPEKIDDYTIKFTWKTWMEPSSDTVKNLMIAQDKVGTIEYSVFRPYIDAAQQILKYQEPCTQKYTDYMGWAPYGRINDADADTRYNDNYKQFQQTKPTIFVGTGPYKLKQLTQTQMILVKNEDYYFKDRIAFDTVLVENIADLSTTFSKLKIGELDYQDGFAPNATLDEIINSNTNMVHIKAYDPATVGILFNIKNEKFSPKVREAFQYIFDREEIKNSANKYATANYYAVTGMAPTEAKKYISQNDFDNLPTYSFDRNKATGLLNEAGWTFSDNKWRLPDGSVVSLTLGYDGSNTIMSSCAEAIQGSLSSFGIETKLSRAADWGTWYQNARDGALYDFVVNWTELGLSFAHPKGCYDFFFNDQNGPIIHFDRITLQDVQNGYCEGYEVGGIKLDLQRHNSEETLKVYQYLEKFYSLNDEELKVATADLLYGVASLNVGVALFQNVSGGFYNSKIINNLPMSSVWKDQGNRNVTTIPAVGSDDYYKCARISLEFANAAAILYGYNPE